MSNLIVRNYHRYSPLLVNASYCNTNGISHRFRHSCRKSDSKKEAHPIKLVLNKELCQQYGEAA